MIKPETIIVWMLLLNSGALGLFFWCYKRLPESGSKKSFLFFIFGYLIWLNPLLSVHLLTIDSPLVELAGRLILAGGCIFVGSLGHFIISFAKPEEIKTLRYKLFQFNFFILFCMAFAGLLEQGVQETAYGLAPIKGPFQPYFDISVTAFGIYFLTVCGLTYKNTKSRLLRAQLRTIFWTCLPSFGIGLMTNAIIPGLTGNFQLTPTGGLWLLFFFIGITYILICGKTILVRESFRNFLSSPSIDPAENMQPIRRMIDSLRLLELDEKEKFRRSIAFKTRDGNSVNALIAREPLPSLISDCSPNKAELSNAINNAISRQVSLHQENVSLISQMLTHKTRASFSKESNKDEISILRCSSEYIFLEEYKDKVFLNYQEHKGEYGQGLIAFSSGTQRTLEKIKLIASSPGNVIFEGETGVGKTFFAKLAHRLRGGVDLSEIFCDGKSSDEILALLHQHFEGRKLGCTEGVLLKHFDKCTEANLKFYEEIFRSELILADLIYFTASPGFFKIVSSLPTELADKLYQNRVYVAPLRERKEDIFYLLVWFILKYSEIHNLPIEAIDKKAIKRAELFSWRGNLRELRQIAELAVLTAQSGIINNFNLESAVGISELDRMKENEIFERRLECLA